MICPGATVEKVKTVVKPEDAADVPVSGVDEAV